MQFSNIISAFCLKYLLVITFAESNIPNYIKPCQRNDKLAECLLKNSRNVINYLSSNSEPRYKLQQITRFNYKRLDLHATKDLKVIIGNLTYMGLENTDIKNITLNDDKLNLIIQFPRLQLLAQYDFDGSILMLNLNAHGSMNVTIVDIVLDYTANLNIEKREGQMYYYVSDDPMKTSLKKVKVQRIYFEFDNLFPNDNRISEEMNAFLNENWLDVFSEVELALLPQVNTLLINVIINAYLKNIPIEQLFAH